MVAPYWFSRGTFTDNEDYRLPTEKDSAYLSHLVLGLGHDTIEKLQTKVFEIAYMKLERMKKIKKTFTFKLFCIKILT